MEEKNVVAYFSGLSATIKSVKDVQKLYNPQLAFNFNSLNFLRPGENKYSEILAFFLNPKEAHGQGAIFLKLFLKNVGLKDKVSEIDLIDAKCECEHCTDNQRRIDIVITLGHGKFVVAIENKVWAKDLKDQIKDYNEYLNGKFRENYCLLYLTPYQKDPFEISIERTLLNELKEKKQIKLIGYKTDIIACVHEWALNCQAERVRVFLLDFEQYLKQEFSGETFMEENETIANYALKNEDNLEVAFATANALYKIKKKLIEKFKKQLRFLANELDFDIIIDENLGQYEDYTYFRFTKKSSWKHAYICFQFESKNANDFLYGMRFVDEKNPLPPEIANSILQRFNKDFKSDKPRWWFYSYFEDYYRNWNNNFQPWIEIENEKMQLIIKNILVEFIKKIDTTQL